LRPWLLLAGILGALGVGAGAFAAHGLKATLDPDMLAIWETGARYQLIHAVALLGVASLGARAGGAGRLAGFAFCAGILIFSGSLYVLAVTGLRWLGAITPLGGLLLILGWLLLAWEGWRAPRDKAPSP